MPKKVYTIENLDCANCAAKIEDKFNAHPKVEEASITFATRQLRITAEDPDALIPELTEIARSVESGAVILSRDEAHKQEHHHEHHHHEHGEGCCCGHNYGHDHECGCGHEHHHEHDHECGCGHEHHHEHGHECCCGHDHHEEKQEEHAHAHSGEESAKPLLIGAGLFAAGLILENTGLGWLSTLVCLAAYVLLGWEVVKEALENLFKGKMLDENFLMALASLGAFFIGDAPEGVGVMLFYRVGEYFEH